MDKVFLTVLNMSLTGAFVIAATCIARLPLKKAPKIISYCLWAVAGFRLAFPFSIESVFSLIPFKAQTIPSDIAMQPIPRIDSGIPFVNNAVSSILPAATPTASVNPLQIWTAIGAWVWIVGVVILLIYGVVSFFILKGQMSKAAHMEANIYEAENIKSPFVLGIFRPRIYLPLGLSEQEKSYIILHEQTHIKRHDHIIKFGAYFVLCLHWFNPLAWAAFLLMGVDMEMSCDERVLKEMGGETKKDYSLSLLSLATERRVIGGSPLAFSEGGLKARIKNVLNFKKPSRVIIVAAVALVAVLSIGFAVNRSGSLFPMTLDTVHKEPHFAGVVTEVTEGSILVRVNEDEDARRSSDLIYVSLDVKLKDSVSTWFAGDEVIVYYDGMIAESYPAQINTVYAIVMKDNSISMNSMIMLDDLRELAVKGDNLMFEDLQYFRGGDASSNTNYRLMVYSVEGGYRLIVGADVSGGKPDRATLESIWESGGSGIDIRYNDVDEFIRTHPSHPAIVGADALAAAREYAIKEVTLIDTDWWEYADEFPHEPKDPFKQTLRKSLDSIESSELFMDADGGFIAVGREYGTVYVYRDGVWISAYDAALEAVPPSEILSPTEIVRQELLNDGCKMEYVFLMSQGERKSLQGVDNGELATVYASYTEGEYGDAIYCMRYDFERETADSPWTHNEPTVWNGIAVDVAAYAARSHYAEQTGFNYEDVIVAWAYQEIDKMVFSIQPKAHYAAFYIGGNNDDPIVIILTSRDGQSHWEVIEYDGAAVTH